MRIALGGYGGGRQGIVQVLTEAIAFYPFAYITAGYTIFDVICIGASGSRGGGLNTGGLNPEGYDPDEFPFMRRLWGGAGGGGGIHRVRGFLADLPDECGIVVGQAGDDEADVTDPAYGAPDPDTDKGFHDLVGGVDGGYSSFAGTVCMASGGKKGRQPFYNYDADYKFDVGIGGVGGIGGRTTAGGGGGGFPYGDDGPWSGTLGAGGKGGDGGIGDWSGKITNVAATDAGRGAYVPEDTSVSGAAGSSSGTDGFPNNVRPGDGGGARPTPLNGLLQEYGTKVGGRPGHGFVIIKIL